MAGKSAMKLEIENLEEYKPRLRHPGILEHLSTIFSVRVEDILTIYNDFHDGAYTPGKEHLSNLNIISKKSAVVEAEFLTEGKLFEIAHSVSKVPYYEKYNIIMLDCETHHKNGIAHQLRTIQIFIPGLNRLIFMEYSSEDTFKIYRANGTEIRILKTENPEFFFQKALPELLLNSIFSLYLEHGSHLSLANIPLEEFINVDTGYMLDSFNIPSFISAHNVAYDIPIFTDFLKSFKKAEVLRLDRGFGEKITIPLYEGTFKIKSRLMYLENKIFTGSLTFGSLQFRLLDTMNLAGFYSKMGKSLANLSKNFNKVFTKLEFDTSEFSDDVLSEDAIAYALTDVLATHELLHTLPEAIIELGEVYKNIEFDIDSEKYNFAEFFPKTKSDIISILSPATLPKKIMERFIKAFGEEKYKTNAKLTKDFYYFFYGGRVRTHKIGKLEDVMYYDFKSQYPHVFNSIGMENIVLNYCKKDISEIVKPYSDDFRKEIKHVVDKILKEKSLIPLKEFSFKYPYGVFYVTSSVKYLASKSIKKGEVVLPRTPKKNRYERVVSSHRDVYLEGSYNSDLYELIYNLLSYRLQGKPWKWIYSKIVVKPEHSIYFQMEKLINIEGEHYGVKASSPIFLSLKYRDIFKKKLKEIEDKDSENYKYYDALQYAIKQNANSFFGIFGDNSWTYENPVIASSVTSFARFLSRFAELMASFWDIDKYYVDTDGIMLENHPAIKEVTNYFLGVDELELEDELEVFTPLFSKFYRYTDKKYGRMTIRTHGRGSYDYSYAHIEKGREKKVKLFDYNFFDNAFNYLSGHEEAGLYSCRLIRTESKRSGSSSNAKLFRNVEYKKARVEAIANQGYYMEGSDIYTHVLPRNSRSIGKFFKVYQVEIPGLEEVREELAEVKESLKAYYEVSGWMEFYRFISEEFAAGGYGEVLADDENLRTLYMPQIKKLAKYFKIHYYKHSNFFLRLFEKIKEYSDIKDLLGKASGKDIIAEYEAYDSATVSFMEERLYKLEDMLTESLSPFNSIIPKRVITAYYSNQEYADGMDAITYLLKRIGLRIKKKSAKEYIINRLKVFNRNYHGEKVRLIDIKKAFSRGEIIRLEYPRITLTQEPFVLDSNLYYNEKYHTCEYYTSIVVPKPTVVRAHVRHYALAISSLYNTSNNVRGEKNPLPVDMRRWVQKTAGEVVFKYSLNENGEIKRVSDDELAQIRCRFSLKVKDVTLEDKPYFSGDLRITIDAEDREEIGYFQSLERKIIARLLEDIKLLRKVFIVSFGEHSPSTSDLFIRFLDTLITLDVLDSIVEALKSSKSQLTALHMAVDYELDKTFEETFLSWFSSTNLKTARAYAPNEAAKEMLIELLESKESSWRQLKDYQAGISINFYNRTKSLYHRVEKVFKDKMTKKAIEKFMTVKEEFDSSEGQTWRVEAVALGMKRYMETKRIFLLAKNIMVLLAKVHASRILSKISAFMLEKKRENLLKERVSKTFKMSNSYTTVIYPFLLVLFSFLDNILIQFPTWLNESSEFSQFKQNPTT